MLKLKVQTARHELQRPKQVSDYRFSQMQKEEVERNESDKKWTEYTNARKEELEQERQDKEQEKIEIQQQDETINNSGTLGDTTKQMDQTDLVQEEEDQSTPVTPMQVDQTETQQTYVSSIVGGLNQTDPTGKSCKC